MDEEGARTDAVIARIAARQHGVGAYWQLRAAGISKDSMWKAARARRPHRIHHGIYAVGHRGLSDEGRWMAAVLACGKGSVLSHWDGAALLELLPVRSGFVDVTVRTAAGRRRRPGIRIHRCPSLTDD